MGCSILPSRSRFTSTEEEIGSETHEVSLEASSKQAGRAEARSDGGLQPLEGPSLSDE